MLTPTIITKHIKSYLPRVTDYFTTYLTVTSAISLGTTITVNSVAHGLLVGNNIVISAGTTRNTLLTAVLINDNSAVRFRVTVDHDLIKPSQLNDNQTLKLSGFGNSWDGYHDILDVPDRLYFDIELPIGETIAPILDTNQYLIDDVGLGLQVISSVPDVDSFIIDIIDIPSMPTSIVDGLKIVSGFRISSAADINRAQAAYAKQNQDEPYLFIISSDVDVSKDRHTQSDAIATFTAQNTMKLTLLQNFSTVVFIPTKNDITGVVASDLVYGAIYSALLRVLHGYSFVETDTAQNYATISTGHGLGIYNTAYLTHVYDWQSPVATTTDGIGFNMQEDVAFRNINMISNVDDDAMTKMSMSINLDEEELS